MTITPRQHEIGRLAASGIPRSEIARRLGVTINTVHTILLRLFRRFGIESRRELAAHLLRCEVRDWNGGGRASSHGFREGDRLTVIGGRFAGRECVYVRAANSDQVRVRIGGGTFALRVKHLAKAEREAA